MSKREKHYEKAGRPATYSGERKPVTVQWPVELLAYIDSVADNRTRWLIEAAQEKRDRELNSKQERN